MDNDFKGVWIPKEIWLDKNLTLQEKILLSKICYLDNNKGCFASNQYFADFLGITKKRASEIIKNLNKKNYVICEIIYKKDSREVSERLIKFCYEGYSIGFKEGILENVNTPPEECDEGIPKNVNTPPPKNVKDNIEYINIQSNNDINNKNLYSSNEEYSQKGKPFCTNATNAETVKNEFEDAEPAQSNTLTDKEQIKVQRQRYNAEQLKFIDQFFNILKYTRKSCKMADSVILKIYQSWNKHEVQKVIYGIGVYINNSSLHDKNEKYVLGIIRNSTTEEINRKEFKNNESYVGKNYENGQKYREYGNTETFNKYREQGETSDPYASVGTIEL